MVNQKPGRFVNIGRIALSKKGYVAIHQEEVGKAGAVIGYSNLLNSGESNNFSVTLNRKSVVGGKSLRYDSLGQQQWNI